ncbi:hybrid sensor histidine kinase/response regulator transcription factor [Sphingobacterium griseoflavum]|uniref:histidine kinase n=1 Tax=Sphingobacterium griseoflavum TaxID=1474952 RepID=A0ABQ3I1D5_9SPHI|nr:response regulator [Sphingobacterium griseoflavum]GHE48330.1 hybrid sensor histidine kinase/response regulator [Sphingobacterium griseoflavum]
MGLILLPTVIRALLFYSFFAIVSLLIVQRSVGQEIGVTSLKIEKELPSLTINRTFQDTDGFIWFATAQGLSRFDAHNLLNFELTDSNRRIVDDQNISDIIETGDHLLLATGNGLYTLNKRSYSIQPFPAAALKNRRVTAMLVDHQSNIWIGTSNAVFVFRPNFTLLKKYVHDPNIKGSIPAGTTNMFYEDKAGNLWMGIWCAGLHKLNKKEDRFVPYPTLGGRNNPFRMFQDDHGQLWIASWGDGMYLFDPQNKKNCYRSVTIQNKRRGGGNEDLCYHILQDPHRKYIWILSFSGISTFQYTKDHALEIVDNSTLFDNTSNIFNDLYLDRSGLLWLSIGGKGVSTVSFDKPEIKNLTFDQVKPRYSILPNVNMLYKDRSGDLWFNLERIGLGKLASKTGEMTTYSNARFKDLISIRAVTSALEVDRQLWIGSSYEPTINVFDNDGADMTLSKKIDLKQWSPQADVPLFFFQDSRHTVWVATANGVFVKKAGEQSFTYMRYLQDYIAGITEDYSGSVWIATKGKGIYQFRNGEIADPVLHLGKETQGIFTEQIETIAADQSGNLWIGTKDSRLLRYHIQQQRTTELANTGLFSKNQLLDIVCLDDMVWLSTTRNIYKVVPTDNSIYEYAANDGLAVNMFSKRAYTVDAAEKSVYFGGYNGAVGFKKTAFTPKKHAQIVVSDIKVNNVSSMIHADNKKFNLHARTLMLEPDDRHIEISFSSMEFAHPEKIRFAYKLEGVDQDWVYAPRERLFATYNNLGKGSYKFLVMATDLNNKWNAAVTALEITKKPAFYESNLAYLLYLLLLAILLYFLISFSVYRLKLRSDLRIAQIEKNNADELIQTKLSYFTNITHDLLTPLTIISCLIDDVQITTQKNLSQFEKMRFNLQRLKRLLQQILDFRRIEHKQMELRVGKNNLTAFLEEMGSAYFSPLAKRNDIDFQIHGSTGEENIYFDIDKLDKIVFNLLSNAFKYTSAGGKITVSYKTEWQNEVFWLYINVQDSGIGIAPEEMDKIFIPFYTNRQTKQQESNGIGLALTKDLVQAHRGHIRVESTIHRGSCFRVVIPVNRESYSEAELQHAQQLREVPAEITVAEGQHVHLPPALQGDALQLLLVEDNEDLRTTIASVLGRNYKVYSASHGQEALEILQKTDIDMVISDIMMPVMDGLTFCRTIKSNVDSNHIPVLLLTAKASTDDRIACYEAGADGYISKPFEIKILEARIHSFIINKRVRQSDFKNSPQINISALDYTPVDEQFLTKMIAFIEENLADERFDVLILGDKLGLSKSTLYRKTKVLLDLSPSELIKNIRLKRACQMMDQDKSISVSEVAFSTGFADPRYFSTCFKAAFSMTPTAYQRRNQGGNI